MGTRPSAPRRQETSYQTERRPPCDCGGIAMTATRARIYVPGPGPTYGHRPNDIMLTL